MLSIIMFGVVNVDESLTDVAVYLGKGHVARRTSSTMFWDAGFSGFLVSFIRFNNDSLNVVCFPPIRHRDPLVRIFCGAKPATPDAFPADVLHRPQDQIRKRKSSP